MSVGQINHRERLIVVNRQILSSAVVDPQMTTIESSFRYNRAVGRGPAARWIVVKSYDVPANSVAITHIPVVFVPRHVPAPLMRDRMAATVEEETAGQYRWRFRYRRHGRRDRNAIDAGK